MRTFIFIAALLAATGVVAAPDWRTMSVGCINLPTDKEVADCLRAGVQAQKKAEEDENNKKTAAHAEELNRTVRWVVRDTASSITSFTGSKLGEKGASLSVVRDAGRDATQAKLALFGVFEEQFGGRFQPFVGAAWLRDGATSPKKDIRQLTAGAVGTLFQTDGAGDEAVTIFHALQLSRRYDGYGSTDGTVGRLQLDLSYAPLSSGTLLGGLAVLPHVAALWQRRTDGGVERGNWRSMYAGVQLEKPFALGNQRFKVSAVARKLYDTSVPDGNLERRLRYANLSLDYYFYDPDNKSAPLQPSLFITKERGTDFLEYGKSTNKTLGGVRLKFN